MAVFIIAEVPDAVRLLRANVSLEFMLELGVSCPESLKRRSWTLVSGRSGKLRVEGMAFPFPALVESGLSEIGFLFSFSIVEFSN